SNDERTRRFFASTYLQMPKDAHLPILNRIGRFVRAKYIRNCLCPPTQTKMTHEEIKARQLNIRRAMDESKILLFNLSDGLLGEVASQLIGQLIVSKFQTATMSRADVAKQERKPFYLYLDEFQNFCGVASRSYERILSRARKYKLGLILAHQQTGQLSVELMREIFGNVSTIVSFQLSQSDATKLSREFMTQVDYGIEPVPTEEFLRLNVGDAYVKIGRSAFPMKVPKVDELPDFQLAKSITERSQKLYGIPRLKPDQRIESLGPDIDPLAGLEAEDIFE
ncbi:MAG TPA: type IV secretory system conjugative DNA transfer family protein, partial [candidate division Zixibacteria bacterium]|nr:type IV secretory system conjugative DNA transfer family protein [candidate division Zixibacteria bacterium]